MSTFYITALLLTLPRIAIAATVPVSIQQRRGSDKTSQTKPAQQPGQDPNSEKSVPCRLWMAPSHTRTDRHPKYGLYAGIDYNENETIPNSELGIPLIDWEHEFNRNTPRNNKIVEFVESFLWTSEFAGTKWEGNYSAPIAIPGVGVLANYHSGIANVDHLQASVLLRHGLPYFPPRPGQYHPSRGSVTPYYNLTFKATKHIVAGMEIFADYGDVWDGNYTNDLYQDLITRFDYEEADKIVYSLLDFFQAHNLSPGNGSNRTNVTSMELQQDIIDFFLGPVLERAAGKHAKVIRGLIPAHPTKLQQVKDRGGTFMYRYPDLQKSKAWLEKHGMCLDNLRAGPSTIPDAGRGAFTTRTIKRGEVITPSPMLHIANQDLMNMYRIIQTQSSDGTVRRDYNRSVPIGQQLLLNYCFSHPESSLLLFPLGPLVTLINHFRPIDDVGYSASTGASSSHVLPNAYLTWSKDKSLANQHEFHDYSVSELSDLNRIALVMKVVALRDIAVGEEVLIDYGPEWEQAFRHFKENWKKYSSEQRQQGMPSPLTAQDMRERYRYQPLETRATISDVISRHRPHPYPPTVGTACFLRTTEPPDGQPKVDPETGHDLSIFVMPVTRFEYEGDHLFIVDVLDRTPVLLEPATSFNGNDSQDWFYNYTVLARVGANAFEVVQNVPHRACTFVDKPYASEIFYPNAFRHKIGILDNHFPQAWRDLRA